MARNNTFAQKLSTRLSVLLTGLLTMAMLPAGCGSGSSTTTTPATVTQIALTGPSSIAAGLTGQMTATATYSDGTAQDVTTSVTWTSDDATTLTISDDSQNKGLVKAVLVGTTHVHAALSGQTGDAIVTVSQAVLESIAISPSNSALIQGTAVQLSAVGTYSDGTTQDISTQVQWTAGNLSIAAVSNDLGSVGLVTAVGVGSTSLTAALNNVTASVQITVTAPVLSSLQISSGSASANVGDSIQLSTMGTFSDGSMQDLTTTVTWSSSDSTIGSVSNDAGTQGLVTAVGSGTVTLTAVLGNISATFDLTIN